MDGQKEEESMIPANFFIEQDKVYARLKESRTRVRTSSEDGVSTVIRAYKAGQEAAKLIAEARGPDLDITVDGFLSVLLDAPRKQQQEVVLIMTQVIADYAQVAGDDERNAKAIDIAKKIVRTVGRP